jgi:hypothetical protein
VKGQYEGRFTKEGGGSFYGDYYFSLGLSWIWREES